MFDQHGVASVILDSDCFRDRNGQVIAWVHNESVYSLGGQHRGWLVGGVLYDSSNRALSFVRGASGNLPSHPGMSGSPGMPGMSGKPGRPGLGGAPGRPGRGGWSSEPPVDYLART